MRGALAALVLMAAAAAHPPAARAAESDANCTGFIDSIPATIGTQGTWCLRKHLSTAITSGPAIAITANNVVLDCNDYKLGGLAAGNGSLAYGIHATSYQTRNTTVRNCNVRGFAYGIIVYGTGALVEDNRLDNSLYAGIWVTGENGRIRRNAVYDTGGYTSVAYGIAGGAVDMIDNTVSGVFGTGSQTYPHGISATGSGFEIRGNRVRGLVVAGSGVATGIQVSGAGVRLTGNHISAQAMTTGSGILFIGDGTTDACTGNTVANFTIDYHGCDEDAGNLSLPFSLEIPPFPPNP